MKLDYWIPEDVSPFDPIGMGSNAFLHSKRCRSAQLANELQIVPAANVVRGALSLALSSMPSAVLAVWSSQDSVDTSLGPSVSRFELIWAHTTEVAVPT